MFISLVELYDPLNKQRIKNLTLTWIRGQRTFQENSSLLYLKNEIHLKALLFFSLLFVVIKDQSCKQSF